MFGSAELSMNLAMLMGVVTIAVLVSSLITGLKDKK
jgi:hypothetical protein